jgi:hypothetical protein
MSLIYRFDPNSYTEGIQIRIKAFGQKGRENVLRDGQKLVRNTSRVWTALNLDPGKHKSL